MTAPPRELHTRRLRLRPVAAGDLEALLALRNEPRVLAGTATGEQLPGERMERQLQRWLGLWQQRGFGTWMIELDGEAVGFVALDPMGDGYGDDVDPEAPELGVVVHPDHWGNGIAGEAGLAVTADCFDRAGLSCVYATVDPGNAQSLAVVAKVPGARRISLADDEVVYELSAQA